ALAPRVRPRLPRSPRAARGEPLHRDPRAAGPPGPLEHAGGPRPGLRAHRAGQGRGRAAGARGPRAQERGDPDRHPARPAVRPAPGRRGGDRDHLRVARHRPPGGGGDLQPRLLGGAGRGTGGLADLRHREPAGGPGLRGARSPRPHRGRLMRRDPVFWLSAAALGLILLAAVFAERLAPYGPNEQDILKRLQPPGIPGHVLGTDEVGRDILSRLIHGARISLLIGVIAVGVSCPLGVLVGLVAGYAGRRTDDVLMHVTDIQLAIPTILLAIAVVAVLGPGLPNVIITLSVTGWTLYARLVRGQTMTVKTRDFVQAARASGAGDTRIVLRHVLPNVFSPVIVVAVFAVANMIVLEATLSFLGLGVPPSVVTWGRMLNGGRLYLSTAWWLTAFPGLAIFVTVLAVNLLGDHLRDWLDPRLRGSLGAAA